MKLEYNDLPAGLPAPFDDGAAAHLTGRTLPNLTLPATNGKDVSLRELGDGWTIFYAYPMTGVPGVPLPEGWNDIPGARGCTPQACGFRDHYNELRELGASVYGLSTQSPAYQREMAERLHLPFPVLSDEHFHLTDALQLPSMVVHGIRLLRRTTLLIRDSRIEQVLYPVFPPDASATQTIAALRSRTHLKER